MQSYAYEEQYYERVEGILKLLKDKLTTKLILLITFIFSEDKSKFYECLRIKSETSENENNFNYIL